jgi:two-component system, OmpR family, sensor histidine kinase CreC
VSTTSRILIAFLVLLALGLLILERQLTWRVQRQYLEAVEEPMVDMAQLFATLIEQQVRDDGSIEVEGIRRAWKAAGERQFAAQIYNVTKTSVNAQLYVTDRRGLVLFDSDGGRAEGQNYLWRRDVGLTLSGQYGARATRLDPADEDSATMFVAAPIRHEGQIIGVASVSKPITSVLPFRDETRVWMRNLSLAFLALVTAGAYFIVTHFSRPIRRLTTYAHTIARGERAALPEGGTPEIATLGRAFEEMRDALDGRAYVENYVQTLTHEMKSPVAAIRGAAELLREESMPAERRDRFLGNIQAEAGRIQILIDRLLGLTAIENRKTLEHPEPVPLADLIEAVREQLLPAAEARGVRIEIEAGARPTVMGESFLLEIALANLLQNAIGFSPAGGRIRVGISCPSEAGWVEVFLEDEGPGIPEYALPRIFERFYSLSHPATGRKSSGLGLCFVREAVELHRGTVTVGNRGDGVGVCAVMRLPVGEGTDR